MQYSTRSPSELVKRSSHSVNPAQFCLSYRHSMTRVRHPPFFRSQGPIIVFREPVSKSVLPAHQRCPANLTHRLGKRIFKEHAFGRQFINMRHALGFTAIATDLLSAKIINQKKRCSAFGGGNRQKYRHPDPIHKKLMHSVSLFICLPSSVHGLKEPLQIVIPAVHPPRWQQASMSSTSRAMSADKCS